MQVKVLVENDSVKGYRSEHGLSLYIEKDGKKYLLDVGESRKFAFNAKKMGVDIEDIDAVFISHNHIDHMGGLGAFFKKNTKAKVYIKAAAKRAHYYKKIAGGYIDIGSNKWMEKFPERFVFVEDHMDIDGIHLLSDTVGDRDFFCQDFLLFKKEDGAYTQDDFVHEMIVAMEEKGEMHVFSSCSHRGIVNIVNTVKKEFKKPLGIVMGGFHMQKNGGRALNCTTDYLDSVVQELLKTDVQKYYTGHCTGAAAYALLKEKMGNRLDKMMIGQTLEI